MIFIITFKTRGSLLGTYEEPVCAECLTLNGICSPSPDGDKTGHILAAGKGGCLPGSLEAHVWLEGQDIENFTTDKG